LLSNKGTVAGSGCAFRTLDLLNSALDGFALSFSDSLEFDTGMALRWFGGISSPGLVYCQRKGLATMKRHWIEYSEHWTPGPMKFWVHVPSEMRQPP
jgi:hypothetical protein